MCMKLPFSPIRRRLSKPLSGAPECPTHRPFRKLDLKLAGKEYKDYKVQARKGYYAIAPQR